MSEAVELALEGVRAFNESDWDALARLYHPEAELDPPAEWPEGRRARGWPQVQAQYERLKEDWSRDRVEVVSIAEASPGAVLGHLKWETTGAGSGVDLEWFVWAVYRVDGNRIVRASFFTDEATARAGIEAVDE